MLVWWHPAGWILLASGFSFHVGGIGKDTGHGQSFLPFMASVSPFNFFELRVHWVSLKYSIISQNFIKYSKILVGCEEVIYIKLKGPFPQVKKDKINYETAVNAFIKQEGKFNGDLSIKKSLLTFAKDVINAVKKWIKHSINRTSGLGNRNFFCTNCQGQDMGLEKR